MATEEDDREEDDQRQRRRLDALSVAPLGVKSKEDEKMTVTVGTRYCPVTCDAITKCDKASEYWDKVQKDIAAEEAAASGNDEIVEVQHYEVEGGEEAAEAEGADNGEEETPVVDDTAGEDGEDTPDDGEVEGEGEGEEVVSEGMITEEEVAEEASSSDNIMSEAVDDINEKIDADDVAAAPVDEVAAEEYTVDNVEGSGEGEELISEGKVAEDGQDCEADNPAFLYKDRPRQDCAYIVANSPEKCKKLHNEEIIGVVSCPKSCGMTEECLELKEGLDNVTFTPVEEENEQGATTAEEGIANEEAEVVRDEDDAIQEDTVETIEYPEDKALVDGNVDSSGDTATPGEEAEVIADTVTSIADVVCEDDPTFLYKDIEGRDCKYVAENGKCEKLHNEEKIGPASCPVACDMVKECEEMYGASGTVMKEGEEKDGSDVDVDTVLEGSGVVEAAPSMGGEDEEIGTATKDMGDAVFGSGVAGEEEVLPVEGTKSMADEIASGDESSSFGTTTLGGEGGDDNEGDTWQGEEDATPAANTATYNWDDEEMEEAEELGMNNYVNKNQWSEDWDNEGEKNDDEEWGGETFEDYKGMGGVGNNDVSLCYEFSDLTGYCMFYNPSL